MVKTTLKIDEIDKKIISIIQKDPNLTYSQIAKKINRSQPTVGARVKKLKSEGILQVQPGVNFKRVDIKLGLVRLSVKNTNEILEMVKYCPFMLNSFKLSGKHNIIILMASTNIKKIYNVVNHHFRTNSRIQNVSMNVITDIAKDLIFPVDFHSEVLEPILKDGCDANCQYCKIKKIMRFKH